MPSTFSPGLAVEIQTQGENPGQWGNKENANLLMLDQRLTGRSTINMAGVSGTFTPTAAQLESGYLYLYGALAGATNLVFPETAPALSSPGGVGEYTIVNHTTGGTLTVYCASTSNPGTQIPAGLTMKVFVNPDTTPDQGVLAPLPVYSALPSLSVTNALSAGSLSTSGNASVGGTLSVTGTTALAAGSTVAGAPLVGTPSGMVQMWPGPIPTIPAGWLLCDGTAYSRTTYAALLAALTTQVTGNTNGSTTVSGTSLNLTGYNLIGAKVEGSGIPAGTTVTAVTATTITLSAAATSTVNGNALTLFPHGNGNGSTTFNVPPYSGRTPVGIDPAGAVLSGVANIGATTGSGTAALVTANAPSHTHGVSGTTGNDSPDHTHAISLNSGPGLRTMRTQGFHPLLAPERPAHLGGLGCERECGAEDGSRGRHSRRGGRARPGPGGSHAAARGDPRCAPTA